MCGKDSWKGNAVIRIWFVVKTPLFSQKFESQCSNPDKIKTYTLRDMETRYVKKAGDYSIEFIVL